MENEAVTDIVFAKRNRHNTEWMPDAGKKQGRRCGMRMRARSPGTATNPEAVSL